MRVLAAIAAMGLVAAACGGGGDDGARVGALEPAGETVAATETEIAGLEGDADALRERITLLRDELQSLEALAEESQAARADADATADGLAARVGELEALPGVLALADLTPEVSRLTVERDELLGEIGELEAAVATLELAANPPPAPTFGDGVHRVGADIQAGIYRNQGAREGCYWERLSGFGGDLEDLIANEFSDSQQIVTIRATDAGFSSERCGTWTLIEG